MSARAAGANRESVTRRPGRRRAAATRQGQDGVTDALLSSGAHTPDADRSISLSGELLSGGQLLAIDPAARVDQLLDLLVDVPHVDVHAGDDASVREPEGDELARRWVAAEDDLVPAGRVTGVLHADVVLVGEEVRDPVVGDLVPEHGARR